MIKIQLDDPTTIKNNHLAHFKPIVLTKLYYQIIKAKREKNYSIIWMLHYLHAKVDEVLVGERKELKEIIAHIEKYYFISPSKLSKIKKDREYEVDGKLGRKAVQDGLGNFIIENSLCKHLDNKASELIKTFNNEMDNLKEKWKVHKEVLEYIFDYNSFSSASTGWSAYELAERLNVSVCPYCNRLFTTLIKKEGKEENQTRPDFDHYYPKSNYPYLGISLYNLIPSCGVCNRSMKGIKDFYVSEAIYPYEEGFLDVATFGTDLDYTSANSYRYLMGQSVNFNVTFKINTADKALHNRLETAIKAFSLEGIYNSHKDIILDIIWISRLNTEDRFNELFNKVGYMFKSKEEFTERFFMNYITPEKQGKRPLAKLTQDIKEELRLSFDSQ
ncbi:hypothetical protein C1N61_30435 (plasmid) [Priestia aryabhattai]